jgi:hypothetical protein
MGPGANPERHNPALLHGRHRRAHRRASHHDLGGTVRVERVTPVADGIVKLRLVAPDGRALPRWTPGSHIDVECGGPNCRASIRCAAIRPMANALEIAVLRDPESRGGSAWVHANVRPATAARSAARATTSARRVAPARSSSSPAASASRRSCAMARRARALGMDYALHYTGRSAPPWPSSTNWRRCMANACICTARTRALAWTCRRCWRSRKRIRRCMPAARCACSKRWKQACAGWPEDALRIEHFDDSTAALDPAKEHAFEVELKDSGLVP